MGCATLPPTYTDDILKWNNETSLMHKAQRTVIMRILIDVNLHDGSINIIYII